MTRGGVGGWLGSGSCPREVVTVNAAILSEPNMATSLRNTSLLSKSLAIQWDAPSEPNGVVTYEVGRSRSLVVCLYQHDHAHCSYSPTNR